MTLNPHCHFPHRHSDISSVQPVDRQPSGSGISGKKPKMCCPSPACYPSLLSEFSSLQESSTAVAGPHQSDQRWTSQQKEASSSQQPELFASSHSGKLNPDKEHRSQKTSRSMTLHVLILYVCGNKTCWSSCPGHNHPNRWQLSFQPVL